jgi:hypothetical protein
MPECRETSGSRRRGRQGARLAHACVLGLALLGTMAAAPSAHRLAADEPAKKKKVVPPGPADVPRASRVAKTPVEPTDFKSAHFLVHTDLPAPEAHELLNRLEIMLGLISKYWGHPPAATIECYVVNDLKHWPADSMDPAGRAKIEQGAGITLVDTLSRGNQTLAAKAVVYAVADRGTPQHEAVHAYCGQTFGRTGPLWYAEGMAEMGQYWRQGDSSVHCHPEVIEYIHSHRPKPLSAIIAEDGVARPGGANARSGDSWQNYAWRWAICHLLENNPNYRQRFRPLGLGFLTGQKVSFADAYGAMLPEIDFEYRFFVQHLDEGYRVDLCSWDWKRKFREPTGSSSMIARVAAARGWQPSGVIVSPDKKYDYSASGLWQTSPGGPEVTADGRPDGGGRLEGIIFKDFALGQPFPLGTYGSFTPPGDGQLYLRCRDKWNELADNHGALSLKIKNSGQGNPLPRPTRTAPEPEETSEAAE